MDSNRDGFIQDLRGIAVLMVVAYHFFEEVYPLGFLGVDVFFTISGYVITKSLLRTSEFDKDSLIRFYSRRVQRLLPSLNLVVLVSLIAAWIFFSPKYQRGVVLESASAILAVSNVYFLFAVDYFSSSSIFRPLLHTWSLGLEEQVYLFFPLFFLIRPTASRIRKIPTLLLLIGFLTAVSCAIYIFLNTYGLQQQGFYNPVSRFWQFGLGALIALTNLRAAGLLQRRATLFNVLYLGLIPGLVLLIRNLFPSDEVWLLSFLVCGLVCIGFIITSVNSSSSLLRLIGDRSYAIYLWHWPLFVYISYISNYVVFIGDVERHILLIAGTFCFAEVSYRLLESKYTEKPWLFPGVALAMALNFLLLTTLYFQAMNRSPNDDTSLEIRAPCLLETKIELSQRKLMGCLDDVQAGDVVFWGSSHLAHYMPAMTRDIESEVTLHKFLIQGCPPLLGMRNSACQNLNRNVLNLLLKRTDLTVVLGANWENHRFKVDFDRNLKAMLGDFSNRSIRVVLIGQTPTFPVDVPTYIENHPKTEELKTVTDTNFNASLKSTVESFGYRYLDIMAIFCTENLCKVHDEGLIFYEDESHLSQYGAEYLHSNGIFNF